jgi:DNA mismatch repair ATPase MutS
VAERARAGGGRVALFLLDEILHGTNTSERQIAARRIILYLLGLGATGAVSTHDLALAAAPELAAVSESVHFAEQFSRGADGLTMTFDYRLRPGVATSTNALKLMEMIGLPAEDESVVVPPASVD